MVNKLILKRNDKLTIECQGEYTQIAENQTNKQKENENENR